MAGKTNILSKTYSIGTEVPVPMYTAVAYGTSDGECVVPVVDNAKPVGIVDEDSITKAPVLGKNVAVKIAGIGEAKLSGNVNYGDMVILGANGSVKALPATAGTYNVLGIAEKSGVDGDVIPVRIALQQIVVG